MGRPAPALRDVPDRGGRVARRPGAEILLSAAGPGTSTANMWRPRASVLELADRWCGDFASLPAGIVQLFTEHWPVLFGTRPVPFYELSIESTGERGVDGSWIILAGAVLLPIATIVYRLLRERRWRPE